MGEGKMTEKIVNLIIIVFCILIGLILASVTYKIIQDREYEKGYIEACKDFYNGKTKYTLVDKKDGTRMWEKIK